MAIRNVNEKLTDIAKKHLGFETLQRQMSGADFREVSVWEVLAALDEAFEAGVAAARGEG